MNKLLAVSGLFGRKSLSLVIPCAILIAGGMLFFAPPMTATPVADKPVAALTVTATFARSISWPSVIEASGSVAPWEEAVIGSQVSNLRLEDLRVNVGDYVKRGQLLATFDADLLSADEARLKANWRQAESNRNRAAQLKGTGSMSDQDVLQYETQADVAKALLTGTQLQLRYARVIAPDDGVISARTATVGAVYGNGQELFRLIRQSRLEWRGELNAAQLTSIRSGQHITLDLPDGTSSTATVREMAPSLDNQTRLGIAYADIEPGSTARAGMYAKGKVGLSESPAVVIPAACIVIRDGRSYVARLLDHNRIEMQAVTVGRRQAEEVEVVSGIGAADKVVLQGAGFLNDGDLVHVAAAPADAKEQP
ncbi:efflux RND transporter periplasmic adaptor subunit [Pseudomonas marginalis]|uniref:efflux RND transporter periplasmic adaptor subunit n=1 Tax=Pseudomonas marginalis TaxID=298 RepID=UPI002B1CB4BA|nr:efflux RND transporter periplasmic adaptor subunit [Pseudomonas marginalis]